MRQEKKVRLIQILLFILTVVSTTLAGTEWRFGKSFYSEEPLLLNQISEGLYFSIPFLLILTFHEFGHYLMARYHNVKVSLPYYIPLWLGFLPGFPSFGTMGAVIRIREKIISRKLYFDIGVAGPLAGFVVALIVIIYGFLNLPSLDYIFEIHPEYAKYGADYSQYVYAESAGLGVIRFGPNLLFWILENLLPVNQELLPHPNEIIHYPYFLAGYLALFFTALNLFPIGQLDGGHVMYGILGEKAHRIIAPSFYIGVLFYAGLGLFNPLNFDLTYIFWSAVYIYFLYYCFYSLHPDKKIRWILAIVMYVVQSIVALIFPNVEGYIGWLLFLFLVGRFLGIHHPTVLDNRPLSLKRKIVGWLAVVVFILSFSPKPLVIEISEAPVHEEVEKPVVTQHQSVQEIKSVFDKSNSFD